MSDNRTWQYEPEAGSAVANICEYEGDRCIRFVCEFIDPPSAEDAALMIAGKNEVAALRAELAELRARVAVPDDVAKDALEDLADTVSLALSKAWSLGQTYWSQADSESYKQNKKAAETQQTFNALTDATRAAILAAKENKP